MIVHIIPNSPFAEPFIRSVVEHGSNHNHFIIRQNRVQERELNISGAAITHVRSLSKEVKQIVLGLSNRDKLIVHSLDISVCKMISRLKLRCKIGWVFWGGEFYKVYEQLSSNFTLLDRNTRSVIDQQKDQPKWLRNILHKHLKQIYISIRSRLLLKYMRLCLSKVDEILHYNAYDYELVKNVFSTKARFVEFIYSNISSFTDGEFENQLTLSTSAIGNSSVANVVIGNSAYPTSNHIDILQELPVTPTNTYHIPLSYGKSHYGQHVMKIARMRFGANVRQLTEFLPPKDYVKFLSSMDVGIIGSNRSQGAGNVLLLLQLGKKVLLKSNNPLYVFLKELGCHVYTCDVIDPKELQIPLTTKEKNYNRFIVNKLTSPHRIEQIYSDVF